MKVLLVNGSPHQFGCTNRALTEIATTLESLGIESEIFWIGTKPLSGCIDCRSCVKTGKCVFDDVVNAFREKAREADGFFFGSPVHYGAVAGSMTCFMDRLFFSDQLGNEGSAFYLKPAASVVSARRAGNTATFDQLNKYYTIMEMPVVPSRYWNMVHGNTPEEVEQDLEGLFTMRTLARNMAYLLQCKQAAKEAGVPMPEREARVGTNFIR